MVDWRVIGGWGRQRQKARRRYVKLPEGPRPPPPMMPPRTRLPCATTNVCHRLLYGLMGLQLSALPAHAPTHTHPPLCLVLGWLGLVNAAAAAAPQDSGRPSESPRAQSHQRPIAIDSASDFLLSPILLHAPALQTPRPLLLLSLPLFRPLPDHHHCAGRNHVAHPGEARMGRRPRAPDFSRLLQGARTHVWYALTPHCLCCPPLSLQHHVN